MNNFQLSIFCLCLLIGQLLTGQERAEFEQIAFGQEGEQSIVYCLAQDIYNNIWIGTEEGLIRYNSQDAFLYNEYQGLPSSFSNNIQHILVDSNNRIWASSDNKLGLFDPVKNEFHQIFLEKGSNFSLINSISEGANQDIYIGTYNGIWKLNKIEDNKAIDAKFLLDEHSISTIQYFEGKLIIGTNNGIYLLEIMAGSGPKLISSEIILTCAIPYNNGYLFGSRLSGLFVVDKDFEFRSIVFPNINIQNSPVFDIIDDRVNNTFYVGTDGNGILKLDPELKLIRRYRHDANDPTSLASNGVYDLHLDNHQQLWIATYGGGVNTLNTQGNKFENIVHIPNEENSIVNNFTRAILETQEGTIWYGTKEGVSIYYPARKNWQHLPLEKKNNGQSVIVMALAEKGDEIWAGTYGHGAYRINKFTFQTAKYSSSQAAPYTLGIDKIYSIAIGPDETIWFGGIGAPLHYISPNGQTGSLDISQMREIKVGPNNQIFTVGKGGVNIINENKEVSSISGLISGTGNLDYSTLNCIQFDEKGQLWIGTNGDGLIKYNLDTKERTDINKSNGLPSDFVQGIIMRNDQLWVSTSNGIAQIKQSDGERKIVVFNEADGIKNASFNYGSYADLNNGKLAFGSTDGVVLFDPERLEQADVVPNIIFESLDVISKDKNSTIIQLPLRPEENETIELTYKQNFINIKYAGVHHSAPEKITYSWKMDGINDGWSQPIDRNEINFANLAPGEYTFHIKAINRDGNQSPENIINIKITPPWWASKLAYFVYILLGILFILAGIYIARALLTKKMADEQIAFYNNITHELKTPLSILLSKLESSSENGDGVKEIKTTINRLSSLFDQLLNFNKITSDKYQMQKVKKINLKKHLDMIVNSFMPQMEQKNISFTFIDDWKGDFFYYKKDILDKIVFNLMSNAVKYSKEGGTISLETSKSFDGQLLISVKDNGIGIPKDQQNDILKRYYRARNAVNSQLPGTGLGLMIVKNLVEQDKGSISFSSEEGIGTTFKVLISNMIDGYEENPSTQEESTELKVKPPPPFKLSNAKILVVEDNDELRAELISRLRDSYQILEAQNGKEGLELAQKELPDLILTDLIMPEMDGNALCMALQKEEDTNHIPVFMMTVLNNSTQKVESIQSGVSTYMEKPINLPFLIAKINSTLSYKQKLREKYLHETEVDSAIKFKDERDSEFVSDLHEFVISHVKDENLSVQDLCRHVGMSRTALYMKMKEMIDQSPQNFIITTRMNLARKLLLQGGASVKEIAYQVGFSNPKYFSTSFKKQFGQSPSGFLKSLNPQ